MGGMAGRTMTGKLTAREVLYAKKPGKLYDGTHGLFLQVYPSGAKCWQQRITVQRRRRAFGLGGYPTVSLAKAREVACQNWLVARADRDPRPDKRREAVSTFDEAAAAVLKLNAPKWTDPKHPQDWTNSLRRFVSPRLGSRLVSEIETSDLLDVLEPIWHTLPETARRVRQRIRRIMDWSVARGYRVDNPAARALGAVLPSNRLRDKAKHHHAAVPHCEVAAALDAVRSSGASPVLRLLVEFVVLTAVRSGEARGACWSEIDFDTAVWTIPASRMKARCEHQVPLSDRALAILEEVGPPGDDAALVFPGARRGRPFASGSLRALLECLEIPGTVHGFRSSFCDWTAERVPGSDEAAEFALAHGIKNPTKAAYRRTRLLDQRRALMQSWADYVVPQQNPGLLA